MDSNQLSFLLDEITKKYEDAFTIDDHQQEPRNQEHYDPKAVLKMAMSCVNNKTDDLLIDIVEIITLFLIRGPKISKINDKLKDIGKQRIEILKEKYKLKDFANAAEVAQGKALSLRKLISAFPYQLLVIMKSEKYNRPLGNEVLKEAKASNFPGFLKTSSFFSVIPFPKKNSTISWFSNKTGIQKFQTIIQGVIAYEFLESFVVHKWGNNVIPLTPNKALSNVISVAQNTLNSDFITETMRETNFVSMFEKELKDNFKGIENLIFYTESKYPGFKNTLTTHFDYDISTMKFACQSKTFCRHVER